MGRGGRGKEAGSLTSVGAREDSKWLWNGSPAQSHDDRLFLSTTFVYFRHVHLRDGRPVTQQHSLQPVSYSCKRSPVQFLYSTSAATLWKHYIPRQPYKYLCCSPSLLLSPYVYIVRICTNISIQNSPSFYKLSGLSFCFLGGEKFQEQIWRCHWSKWHTLISTRSM